MGEESRDSDADVAAPFNPFLCSPVEYDASTRLQMAEEMAAARKLTVSPALREIITNPDNYFHHCQQSIKSAEDAHQRRQASFNTKREAFIEQRRAERLPLPSKIPMIEINPTRVTLTLEFESQYYSLMTNDYGDYENVASIMKKTNTLIQLPDRFSDGVSPDPFVQQVSITGFYSDVDKARKLMRENCHVSVILSLSEMSIPLTELQKFVRHNPIPNVDLSFFSTPSEKSGKVLYYLRFISRSKNTANLIRAANEISKTAFGTESVHHFSLHFTLSTFHVEHVVGHTSTALLMPEIEKNTKTRINYPRFDSRDDITGNLFVIEVVGGIRGVLEARRCIMDLLPISMCFNMKNTDMAAESGMADRCVHVMIEDQRTMLKMTPSVYEPAELLADEVPLHCASLRSKEFNIRHLYTAYQKVLAKKNDVVAPQPNDYDQSMWHWALPSGFFSFTMPCRGEAPDSAVNLRRHRSVSVTSSRSKTSTRGKRTSESSETHPRPHTRVSSTSEPVATAPVPNMHPSFAPQMQYYFMQQHHHNQQQHTIATFLKGAAGFPNGPALFMQPGIPYYVDPLATLVRPEYLHSLPPEAFYNPAVLPPGLPINPEAERPDSRQRKAARPSGPARGVVPPFSMQQRPARFYEPVREDDGRSSTRSASGRTSLSGDEPVGSLEDRGNYDRQFQHHQPRQYSSRFAEQTTRWKTSSHGDTKHKLPLMMHRGFPNGPSGGSTDYVPSMQFHTTHHLKLKSANEENLDHDRLFTQDCSHTEEPSNYSNEMMDGDFVQRFFSATSLNSSFENDKRSRAASCSLEKDDVASRFAESDYTDQGHQSRSIDNYKKPGTPVSKTMLEPRSRTDRTYCKISLEHRGAAGGSRYFGAEQNSSMVADEKGFVENGGRPESPMQLGGRQFRIDPLKLIASVHKSSEQLPRIHERQFNDVLNEKEREMTGVSIREMNVDSTMVPESTTSEETKELCGLRSEQSSQNTV